ncbi:MAG: DUF951 domain-containing protein [Tindallia sp. MSAO_Bac2]|nr:MAG: DUF951 domain-containing protein [Tindallia sp. MSAO_Bac2]
MQLNPGDRVTLKKPHPCGSKEFDILRTGADFRIKCVGCGHEIWITRPNLERRIRKVETKENREETQRKSE